MTLPNNGAGIIHSWHAEHTGGPITTGSGGFRAAISFAGMHRISDCDDAGILGEVRTVEATLTGAPLGEPRIFARVRAR